MIQIVVTTPPPPKHTDSSSINKTKIYTWLLQTNLYLYGFPAGYSCSLSVGGMGVLLQPNKVV